MSKLAIIATIRIKPERIHEYLLEIRAHAGRCLAEESGTIQFDILQPVNEPDKVILYELFKDDTALESHLNGLLSAQFMKSQEEMIDDMSGYRCSVMD
jgi:quinol monooxygenase YgiN